MEIGVYFVSSVVVNILLGFMVISLYLKWREVEREKIKIKTIANGKLKRKNEENAELKSKLAETKRQAVYDSLTGLLNRFGLDVSVKNIYGRFRRKEVTCLAVAIIDLDNFKPVNDIHGHQTGDEVLKIFATLLLKHTRSTDIVARYGGDEFALVFPDTEAKKVHDILDRVRVEVENYSFPFEDIRLSFSVGVKKSSDSNNSFHKLLKDADHKCLERKRRNKKER